jgi:tetratricopeptide (TPR) repeat protein
LSDSGWEAVHVDELDAIPVAGVVWRPVRRRFGIRAFGVNAYTAEAVGGQIVEEHDESPNGAGGHEEIYVVLRGRATFTIGGEALDAPAGTIVFVRNPKLKRVAIANDDGTVVLAVGGEPGRAYEISPWEFSFAAAPLLDAGRFGEAITLMEDGLRERPGNASLLYNLACGEARAGRAEAATAHLQEAIAAEPRYAERARIDPDFESIRARSDFPGFQGAG